MRDECSAIYGSAVMLLARQEITDQIGSKVAPGLWAKAALAPEDKIGPFEVRGGMSVDLYVGGSHPYGCGRFCIAEYDEGCSDAAVPGRRLGHPGAPVSVSRRLSAAKQSWQWHPMMPEQLACSLDPRFVFERQITN